MLPREGALAPEVRFRPFGRSRAFRPLEHPKYKRRHPERAAGESKDPCICLSFRRTPESASLPMQRVPHLRDGFIVAKVGIVA